jgi:hypothetical protein
LRKLIKKLRNSMIDFAIGGGGPSGYFLFAAIDEFTAVCGEKGVQHCFSVVGDVRPPDCGAFGRR